MKTLCLLLPLLALSACTTNRMTVAETSAIGLSVTPGNGSSQMPQVTFAYKRAEGALIPTRKRPASDTRRADSDCYSAFSALHFDTTFYGPTRLDDILSTGFAARDLLANPEFAHGFSNAVSASTNGPVTTNSPATTPQH